MSEAQKRSLPKLEEGLKEFLNNSEISFALGKLHNALKDSTISENEVNQSKLDTKNSYEIRSVLDNRTKAISGSFQPSMNIKRKMNKSMFNSTGYMTKFSLHNPKLTNSQSFNITKSNFNRSCQCHYPKKQIEQEFYNLNEMKEQYKHLYTKYQLFKKFNSYQINNSISKVNSKYKNLEENEKQAKVVHTLLDLYSNRLNYNLNKNL